VVDIHQESQLTGVNVTIPLYQQVVKFHDLLPANTPGLIDRACDLRWKAVQLLETHDVIKGVQLENGSHRWESVIHLQVHERHLRSVVSAVHNEARRRSAGTNEDDGTVSPTPAEVAQLRLPERVTLAWLWNNISATTWLGGVGLLATAFMLGVGAGEVSVIRELLHLAALQRAGNAGGSLSGISDSLLVDVGGPGREKPLRTSLKVAAAGGEVALSQTAEIIAVNLDKSYFVTHGQELKPHLMSVLPERAALSAGAETDIRVDFLPRSLVASGESVRHLAQDALTDAGHIVLKLHYESNGQHRFLIVNIPVFVRAPLTHGTDIPPTQVVEQKGMVQNTEIGVHELFVSYPQPFANKPSLELQGSSQSMDFTAVEERADGFKIHIGLGTSVGATIRWRAAGKLAP